MEENWRSEDSGLYHYDYVVQDKPSGETLLAAMCAQVPLNDYQGLLKQILLLQTTSF